MVGQIMAQKDVHVLMPGTSKHYMGKRDIADIIILRNLRWEDYPRLSRCPLNSITGNLKRGKSDYGREGDIPGKQRLE